MSNSIQEPGLFDPIDYRHDLFLNGAALLEHYPVFQTLCGQRCGEFSEEFISYIEDASQCAIYYYHNFANEELTGSFIRSHCRLMTMEEENAIGAVISLYSEVIASLVGPIEAASVSYTLTTVILPPPILQVGSAILRGKPFSLRIAPAIGYSTENMYDEHICASVHASNNALYSQHLGTMLSLDLARILDAMPKNEADIAQGLLPHIWLSKDFYASLDAEYPDPNMFLNNNQLMAIHAKNPEPLKRQVYSVDIRGFDPLVKMELFEFYDKEARTVFIRASFKDTEAQDFMVLHVDKGIAWLHSYGEVTWDSPQVWSQIILRIALGLYATLIGEVPNHESLQFLGDRFIFNTERYQSLRKLNLDEVGKQRLSQLNRWPLTKAVGTEPFLTWIGAPTSKQWKALDACEPKLANHLKEGAIGAITLGK